VRDSEPIDLAQPRQVLEEKYEKFRELQSDLQRCEPRVVSLQEAADQLELQSDTASCQEVKQRLALLSHNIRGLIQVCNIYCQNMARVLGRSEQSLGQGIQGPRYDSALVIPALTDQLLGHGAGPFVHPLQPSPPITRDDELNTGVLARSYRFLGRVVRAALPIQALMLLLLGVSSIVPLEHDELICSLQNNLQRSLEPMLRWSNGPPPI